MKVMAVVGVLLASGCFVGCFASAAIPIGSGKSAEQAQHEGLDKLLPAQLTASSQWTGAVRVARIRVWADDDYRAQNMRWQHGFDEQLDYANHVLTPMLGVRLEAEYRPWQRHAPGAQLSEHLEQLARVDSAEDVVWIVGLTSSLSLVASTFEQLGVASLGDRHVVVRGHADVEERKAFERAFPDIDREQRENVLEARRRHKTTAVLIHELAHSLGALHETEPHWVTSAHYSHRAATISPGNRRLMQITLEDRLKPPADRDPRGTARKLLAVLDAGAGWSADDRAALIGGLQDQLGEPSSRTRDRTAGSTPGRASGGTRASTAASTTASTMRETPEGALGGTTSSAPPVRIPIAVMEQYRHAEQLASEHKYDDAAATLEPLLAAYPTHVQIHLLDCDIELERRGPQDPKAVLACDRAAAVSAEPRPALEVAKLRRSIGDPAGERATLVAAEARIATLPPARAAVAWLALADHYYKMEAVTWAENALARTGVGDDHKIAVWARTARVRHGLPRDGARWKLSPDDDAAALAAIHDVFAKVNAGKPDAAAKAAAAEKRWPSLPGLLAARCDLELNRGAVASARQLCARSLAQAESSWALYLSGVIALRAGTKADTKAGIASLRRAITLDPDLRQPWHTLGKVFRRAGATADLDQVIRDYRARFGEPLPQ